MPDLGDYLWTGVMNGNPLGLSIPEGIVDEMEVGALDLADQIIDAYRRNDRQFDAACDDNAQAWTTWNAPVDALRVGMQVTVRITRRTVEGTIKSISTRWIETTDGSVSVEDWTNGLHSWVRVPVPLDLATLGKYPDGARAGDPDA